MPRKTQPRIDESHEPPYADLCYKGKSISSSNKQKDGRSTLSSISLGDLRQSPASERKLERITTAIHKEMKVTVSDEDRKIAALMLVRHEDEQNRLDQSYKEQQQRQEARCKEEEEKLEAEKERLKKLKMRMKRWQEELDLRKRVRHKLEKDKSTQLEQEMKVHEDKWRRLKEEMEDQRKEKWMAAVKDAEERKRNQERLRRCREEEDQKMLQREILVSVEREQRAKMSKALQEMKDRRRLREENRNELLRHVFAKQRLEQEEQDMEGQRRHEMLRKMDHCTKKYTAVMDARLRGIRERGAQEEEQIHKAKLRATLHKTEQLMQKRILYEVNQRKMEKAAQDASEMSRSKAMQIKQRNRLRRVCHQLLQEKLQAEDEEVRRRKETSVAMKERRMERLRRQREQIQEEAHIMARASFQLRHRVRMHTSCNNFDQMVREAQLNAAMGHVKLT
uniref:Trichohyalin-plectin-homology domain-containing protein n=1 Tax=Knipowitschia caucasica TaxID=637954 RepID=A0AAV2JNA6_KNICA